MHDSTLENVDKPTEDASIWWFAGMTHIYRPYTNTHLTNLMYTTTQKNTFLILYNNIYNYNNKKKLFNNKSTI